MIKKKHLIEHVRKLISKDFINFGDNDKQFIERIYSQGINKYKNRLKAISFFNHEKILDAGCGFGQWTLSLSELNKEVYACDYSKKRIKFVNMLKKKLTINTLDTKVLALENLDYPNNFFDSVFCYGVIFITDWKKSLRELFRVLKPGGHIYVNANDIGWYVNLWITEHNKAKDYDPRKLVSDTFLNTLLYENSNKLLKGQNLIINQNEFSSEMTKCGFKNLLVEGEGKIRLNKKSPKPKTFFQESYYGLNGTFEVLASK